MVRLLIGGRFNRGKPRFIRNLPTDPGDAVVEFLRVMGPSHYKELNYWIRPGGKKLHDRLVDEGRIIRLEYGYYGLPGDEKFQVIRY